MADADAPDVQNSSVAVGSGETAVSADRMPVAKWGSTRAELVRAAADRWVDAVQDRAALTRRGVLAYRRPDDAEHVARRRLQVHDRFTTGDHMVLTGRPRAGHCARSNGSRSTACCGEDRRWDATRTSWPVRA